jgi:hypothetical protein
MHQEANIGITEYAALLVGLAKETQDSAATDLSAAAAADSVVDVLGQ